MVLDGTPKRPYKQSTIMTATAKRDAAFLTEKEAAILLSISFRTLQAWRHRKIGPPYVRVGRAIRYEEDALVAWMRARSVSA